LDSLRPLAAVVAVAQHGSFTRAAQHLGVTKAAVSKLVARAEQELGAQLFTRTTRRVELTDAGRTVLDPAQRMVAAAEAAAAVARPHQEVPTGELNVAAPIGFGQRFVGPALTAFALRYPSLSVTLTLDDSVRDVMGDGIDVAIRGGLLQDSSLTCRKIGALPLVVCAAPSYLATRTEPRDPDDINEHEWLVFTPMGVPQQVRFRSRNARSRVKLDGRFRTNDGEVLRTWLVAGLGIGLLPLFWIEDDVAAGRLKVLFRRHTVEGGAIYAVHAHGRTPPKKVSAFVDHLRHSYDSPSVG